MPETTPLDHCWNLFAVGLHLPHVNPLNKSECSQTFFACAALPSPHNLTGGVYVLLASFEVCPIFWFASTIMSHPHSALQLMERSGVKLTLQYDWTPGSCSGPEDWPHMLIHICTALLHNCFPSSLFQKTQHMQWSIPISITQLFPLVSFQKTQHTQWGIPTSFSSSCNIRAMSSYSINFCTQFSLLLWLHIDNVIPTHTALYGGSVQILSVITGQNTYWGV